MPENGHSQQTRYQGYQQASQARSASSDGTPAGAGEPRGPDAAKRLFEQLGELREHVAYLVSVKLGQFKLQLRTLLMFAALGIIGGIAGVAIICIAVAQLLGGIAGGLSLLLDGHLWLGHLITSVVVLLTIGIAVKVAIGRMTSSSRQATVAAFEARKQQQQADYGRDAAQAARPV